MQISIAVIFSGIFKTKDKALHPVNNCLLNSYCLAVGSYIKEGSSPEIFWRFQCGNVIIETKSMEKKLDVGARSSLWTAGPGISFRRELFVD